MGKGEVLAADAKKLALQAGLSDRTLRRAKKELGVKSRRQGFGPGSQFFWGLPEDSEVIQQFRQRDPEDSAERPFREEEAAKPNETFRHSASAAKSAGHAGSNGTGPAPDAVRGWCSGGGHSSRSN